MKSTRKIEDLLTMPIAWLKHPDKPQWSALVFDEVCELRMNDFPDEPLYTVTWCGQALDIEEAPRSWTIPRG